MASPQILAPSGRRYELIYFSRPDTSNELKRFILQVLGLLLLTMKRGRVRHGRLVSCNRKVGCSTYRHNSRL